MTGSFAIQFLITNIIASLLSGCIILIKKLLAKHLSPSIQYYLWLLALLTFLTPFLPQKRLFFLPDNTSTALIPLPEKTVSVHSSSASIINDFSVSVNKDIFPIITTTLIIVWSIGMLCTAAITLYTSFKIIKLYHTSMPVQNRQIKQIFFNCKDITGVKAKTSFRSSAFLQSPVTFGVIRPCIIIPIRLVSGHNTDEIRYILLHELHHCKCKDSLINYLTCLIGIIYWFNPVVWYMKREICTDREIACDTAVLNRLEPKEYINYGNTLITFAEKMSVSSYAASSIGGTKKQIKKRIINIASYQVETPLKKIKSTFIVLLSCALVLSCIPYLSVNASSNNKYKFEESNITDIVEQDYNSFFGNYNGSFALYDLRENSWQLYNREGCQERIPPNSTYKIYSALCALENGIITPSKNNLSWDGVPYSIDAWNQNQSLKTAMQNSVNWYFNLLDEKSGYGHMAQFFHKIHYGNEDLSSGLNRYWLESSLKISPVEQTKLLKQTFTNELGFNEENIQSVKSSLLISSNGIVSLYGKTGTGNVNGKNTSGWFIGFVETPDNTFFFACNIQSDDDANGKTAAKITLDILNENGIYAK